MAGFYHLNRQGWRSAMAPPARGRSRPPRASRLLSCVLAVAARADRAVQPEQVGRIECGLRAAEQQIVEPGVHSHQFAARIAEWPSSAPAARRREVRTPCRPWPRRDTADAILDEGTRAGAIHPVGVIDGWEAIGAIGVMSEVPPRNPVAPAPRRHRRAQPPQAFRRSVREGRSAALSGSGVFGRESRRCIWRRSGWDQMCAQASHRR
jgi:hypothetical protein